MKITLMRINEDTIIRVHNKSKAIINSNGK